MAMGEINSCVCVQNSDEIGGSHKQGILLLLFSQGCVLIWTKVST